MTGENRKLLHSFPWHRTPLGPSDTWPSDMHAVVRMAMYSDFPVATAWGQDGIQIYNDAYNPIYADKHPAAFGAPARESWTEIWPFLGPAIEEVKAARKALWFKDTLLPLAKHGSPEECYFDFSYSPVIDAGDRVLGMLSIAVEKTADYVARRRISMRSLGSELHEEDALPALASELRSLLSDNQMDCAAAILYSADPYTGAPDGVIWTVRTDATQARLFRSVAAQAASRDTIRTLDMDLSNPPADWADCACLVPLLGLDILPRAYLWIVPNRLVPIRESLLPFLQALYSRFQAVMHRSEARQMELGEVRADMAGKEKLYRFLFENIGDGAVYCSTSGAAKDDEIILAANPKICEMTGYSEEEIVGMSRSAFFFPDDPDLEAALKVRERDRRFLGDLVIRAKDGRRVPVELTSNLVPLSSGDLRSLTILRDTSHRIAMDRERSERVRLEAVTNLIGGIAHDFNNLLTVIIGSVDTLLPGLPKGGVQRRVAENALLAADRAGALTAKLLSYSRRQTLNIRAIDLNAFIHEIRPLIQASLGERNTFEMDLGDECPPCSADTSQLTTALINLAVNARDAMPDGGCFRLSTYRVDPATLPAALDKHALKPGGYVAIRASDTGTGIDPQTLQRVFEPFFTTKEVGDGSGLGLPMVHGYMRQLGGDVRLTSEPGIGTGVDLIFPIAEADVGEEIAPPLADIQATGQVVLHVEDNDLVRNQTHQMLEAMGFTPVSTGGPREALARVDSGMHIDIVLTDLVMPGGMSGLQLALELRKRDPSLPIVITTGHDLRGSLANHHERTFEVLRKPYNRALLGSTLLKELRRTR